MESNTKTMYKKHCIYFNSVKKLSEVLGFSDFSHENNFNFWKLIYRYLIVILFITTYSVYSPILIKSKSELTKDVNKQLTFLEIESRFISAILIIVVYFLKNNEIKQTFFECFNFTFRQNYKCNQLDKYCFFPLLNFLMNFVVYLVHFLLFHFIYSLQVYPNFYFTVVLMIYIEFPILQFNYFVTAVCQHIICLNKELEEILTKVKDHNLTKFDPKVILNDVRLIRENYLKLIKLTEFIKKAFALPVTVCLIDFFIEMLFFLQTSYTKLIFSYRNNEEFNFKFFFCNFSVVSALYLKVLQVTNSCENFLKKCSRTNAIISHILNNSKDENINFELRSFLMQNISRPIIFSMEGLFTLDNKMVYSIICALVSYGIVIATYYITLKGDV